MPSARRSALLREKEIIKLKDQLGAYRLPLKSIRGAEKSRQSDYIANNFLNANASSFEALDIVPLINYGRDNVYIELRTNGIIGAVPLFSSETRKIDGGIIVEPKFGWNDIGPLLSSIGWSASPQLLSFPMIPGSAREVPPWVLAGPMVERISILLKSINRGFSLVTETRETPRGRILWQEYASKSMVSGHFNHIPCVFPDLNENNKLRSYIRWGLERIKTSILKASAGDTTSFSLLVRIEYLLNLVKDVPSIIPNQSSLDTLAKTNTLISQSFMLGIQALSWIREERGLAGQHEQDGLSWKIKMSDLFERWVEAVARLWASKFGGAVNTSRQDTSRVSIHWQHPGQKSLSSLIPDVVIETHDTAYIIDAKYKKLYEELDDQKWRELSKDLQEEHRHDLHQVLAYASLFNKPRIVSVLVYPLTDVTYTDLSRSSRLLDRAMIPNANRNLELAIFGLPLSLNQFRGMKDLSDQLDPLRFPLAN
jgi:hypothetical protein